MSIKRFLVELDIYIYICERETVLSEFYFVISCCCLLVYSTYMFTDQVTGVVCMFVQLYNVVVDTELTGKKLLQSGELKRRCTIIPLNKISTKVTDSVKIRHAKSLVSHLQFSYQYLTFLSKIWLLSFALIPSAISVRS